MGLTVEVLESLAISEKEQWQRKVNQGVLKEDRVQQLMALGAMEAVDRFLYVLTQEVSREQLRDSERQIIERRISNLALIPTRKAARKARP